MKEHRSHSKLVQTKAGRYVELDRQRWTISNEDDVLALISECGDYQTQNVCIHQDCLHGNFSDLSTGLAGLIFHKLSSYRVRAAFVGEWDQIESERFRELMSECNRGGQFRFFSNSESAQNWLLS